MKQFPRYFNHVAAKMTGCFSCHADLSDQPHKRNDYPRGRWQVKCHKCGFTKFYDIDGDIKYSYENSEPLEIL